MSVLKTMFIESHADGEGTGHHMVKIVNIFGARDGIAII